MMQEEKHSFVRNIALYQNERYSPVSGWSGRSLLITDRKPVTSEDQMAGWNTFEEASNSLTSPGWKWIEGSAWRVDLSPPNVDSDGWTYAIDFNSIGEFSNGANKMGMIHFARIRRRFRAQSFDVRNICDVSSFTCDHCDQREVEKLSTLFLEKIIDASKQKHPRLFSEPKLVELKTELISQLGLLEGSAKPEVYHMDIVLKKLDDFVNKGMNPLSRASSILASSTNELEISHREEYITPRFCTEEREALAKLLIRKFDVIHEFHCGEKNCGKNCRFSLATCPNKDCGVTCSRKWLAEHDDICPQKVISCERACGVSVMRRVMADHMANECDLRPVQCSFSDMGCDAAIQAKDLKKHLEEAQGVHLELSLKRMKEHQGVITGMYTRVNELERRNSELERNMSQMMAGLAGVTAALKASEVRSEKHLQDQIKKVDQKVSRNTSAVNTLGAEIGGIKRVLSGNNK